MVFWSKGFVINGLGIGVLLFLLFVFRIRKVGLLWFLVLDRFYLCYF